jgi:hypothetical protein
MESFYVTLPCDFKTNHKGYYQTLLSKAIDLNGIWQVGISDISFTKSWFNIKKQQKIKIIYFNPKGEGGVGESDYEDSVIYPSNYTKETIVTEINKAVMKHFQPSYLKKNTDITILHYPVIRFDFILNKFFLYPGTTKEHGLTFILPSQEICYILGYDYDELLDHYRKIYSDYIQHQRDNILNIEIKPLPDDHDKYYKYVPQPVMPFNLEPVKFLYIVSDLCEERSFGSVSRPILRCVEVPYLAQYGDQIFHSYSYPQYFKIIKNNFNTIDIKIRPEINYTKQDSKSEKNEELVEFQSGKILVTLHFRKIGDIKTETRKTGSPDRKSSDQAPLSHSTDTYSETSNENVENNNDNLNNLNNEDLEEVPLIIKPEESKIDVGRHDTRKIIET